MNQARNNLVEIHPLIKAIHDDSVLHPIDIAEILNVSLETVRRWCRKGKLKSYSFGGKYLVFGSDFKEFIKYAQK